MLISNLDPEYVSPVENNLSENRIEIITGEIFGFFQAKFLTRKF